ncbi:MAG: class I SAM-dependent methyltransferase [Clostridia bacterium]|nr:class I SAM-dependent methyltransferase [Clostridia bacterium]
MDRLEKYRPYFTKDYLMGPNSFRLLDELLRRSPGNARFDRTLDLGCGMALTSVFLANETDAGHVYAFDLWVSASDNYTRIQAHHLEDKVIPIHGDAMDMPFAHGYFDAVVSVDAYHYFGCREGVFREKILPFVKKGGSVMIAVPGLREEPKGELKELFTTWAEGDDAELFKTPEWWKNLLAEECGDQCDVAVKEGECFDEAWKDWFDSGHEYGVRDIQFLDKGLDRILNFILIYVRKR